MNHADQTEVILRDSRGNSDTRATLAQFGFGSDSIAKLTAPGGLLHFDAIRTIYRRADGTIYVQHSGTQRGYWSVLDASGAVVNGGCYH